MKFTKLVKHAEGAPGLRFLGLGPNLLPQQGLIKLQNLFDNHAFWAKGRSIQQIRRLLSGSSVVITLWLNDRIVGFGRATTDGIFRAVLWGIAN